MRLSRQLGATAWPGQILFRDLCCPISHGEERCSFQHPPGSCRRTRFWSTTVGALLDRDEKGSGVRRALCIAGEWHLGQLSDIPTAIAGAPTILFQFFSDILNDHPLRMWLSVFGLLAQLEPIPVTVQAFLVIVQLVVLPDNL